MCSSVPVLRLLAFLFLLVAFLACIVGFFSPFWIEYHPSKASSSLSAASSSSSSSAPSSPQPSDVNSATPGSPATLSTLTFTASWQTIHVPPSKMRNNTVKGEDAPPGEASEQRASDGREDGAARAEGEAANVTSGAIRRMFEGLWARCDENLVCRCFAQNNFQMEKEFPDWHKAAQGLFTIGLLLLLITLLIGGCYLCCRCCKESFVLATVLGAFALAGFLPIALSLVIYGGFANHSRNIEMTGEGDRFAWGFFLSVVGALVVPLAALLYFLDGRRKEIIEHEDCETAKMV